MGTTTNEHACAYICTTDFFAPPFNTTTLSIYIWMCLWAFTILFVYLWSDGKGEMMFLKMSSLKSSSTNKNLWNIWWHGEHSWDSDMVDAFSSLSVFFCALFCLADKNVIITFGTLIIGRHFLFDMNASMRCIDNQQTWKLLGHKWHWFHR